MSSLRAVAAASAFYLLAYFSGCGGIDLNLAHDNKPSHELLPQIGFGTAGLQSRTFAATLSALRLGCKMIDSAQAAEWYDEAAAGDALREFYKENLHSEVVRIITKVHPRSFEMGEMKRMLQQSQLNFRASIEFEGKSRLDVVLLHSPWCWRGSCTAQEEQITWRTAWRNLEDLQDELQIKHIGVSNFGLELLQELALRLANRKVAVIQNWMDPFHQDRDVRAFAREHGIQYQAYSSLGTQWVHSGRRDGLSNPVLSSPVLQAIAEKHHTSVARVVIAWVSIEGAIALPRSGSEEHIQENFGLLSSIDPAEVTAHGRLSAEYEAIRQQVPLDSADLAMIRGLDGTLGNPWD